MPGSDGGEGGAHQALAVPGESEGGLVWAMPPKADRRLSACLTVGVRGWRCWQQTHRAAGVHWLHSMRWLMTRV